MKLKKLGVHILGGVACACMALAVTFAVPQAAHAATHYFTGNSEVDATWGRAWVTYVNNYGVNQDTLNRIGKYNIIIDLADEGKPVQLNGQLGGYTYSGTDYQGGYHDIGYGNNARRGYYTFTLRWPSAVGGVGWQGGFYIVARGKGTLSMTKQSFAPSEVGQISGAVKLDNTNTNAQVTYTYTGFTSDGRSYNSTTAPTEPGKYEVKAQVGNDKLLYLLGYSTGSVGFEIKQPDTNPGGGSNPGGGNPGGGSNPGGGNPGGGSGGGGSGGGTKPSPEETDPYGDGFAFSIQSESN